jgi:hypothetical protein
MDAADSSVLPENERRTSLCLAPFSKEFFIATGYSKLQVPDDYLKLVRVIVWHNRSCLKKGGKNLSPAKLELFLRQEMSQDFGDLGIEIDDFLADLVKIRHAEENSFAIYNKYIQEHLPTSQNNATNLSSPSSNTGKKAGDFPKQVILSSSANLLTKFAKVSNENTNSSTTIDKPIILKNQEIR